MVTQRKIFEEEAPASATTTKRSISDEIERSLSIARELSTGLEHHQSENVEEVRLARALAFNIVDLLESMMARRARDVDATKTPGVAEASRLSNQR
jgi:hypothetical protein